jgi:hypothetical protein
LRSDGLETATGLQVNLDRSSVKIGSKPSRPPEPRLIGI